MKVLAVLIVAVLAVFPAFAQSPDLLEKAKKGDIDSQLKLASNYESGIDGPKDMARAIEWLRKAGSLGSQEALFRLGMLAYNGDVFGEGVAEDSSTSWACFEAAAVLGNEEARRERDRVAQELTPLQMEKAHLRAAAFFIDGTMAPKNVANARDELRTSPTAKPSTAAVLLGMTYLDPALEAPNADKAIEYCLPAEKERIRNASHCLGKAYELKGDDKSAFTHFLNAAKDGKVAAMLNVAKRYHDGRGTKVDNVMAAAWAMNAGQYGEAPELYSSITAILTPNQIKEVQLKSTQLRGIVHGLPY